MVQLNILHFDRRVFSDSMNKFNGHIDVLYNSMLKYI